MDIEFNKNEDKMGLLISAMENKLQKIYLGGGKSRIDKLHEQLQLAKANADGKAYEVSRTKRNKNQESGEVTKVEVMRKVKPWYFVSDAGKVMMQVKYGAKVLELAKGKSSIEIASADKLISTIEKLKKAVSDGELDTQIEAALK